MHELSLAESLIGLIEDEARSSGFNQVLKVWLEIGALSGVEPEALRVGFEFAAHSTLAQGAELEISTPPGEAWCLECQRPILIAAYHDGCPHCSGYRLRVTGGDQFKLKELEVA